MLHKCTKITAWGLNLYGRAISAWPMKWMPVALVGHAINTCPAGGFSVARTIRQPDSRGQPDMECGRQRPGQPIRLPVARRKRSAIRPSVRVIWHARGRRAKARIGAWSLRHGMGLPPDRPIAHPRAASFVMSGPWRETCVAAREAQCATNHRRRQDRRTD
eukprot:scaffold2207_cov370-Prasinococcus_capsulatus_cf.AAC.2